MFTFRGIRADGANGPHALQIQPDPLQDCARMRRDSRPRQGPAGAPGQQRIASANREDGRSDPLARTYERVLVLLDFKARGRALLRYAAGIAVKRRSAMMAVHVIDSQPWFESDGPCGYFLPEEKLFFTARAAAGKLDLFLAMNNAPWAESTVLYGKTGEALAKLIAGWKPDLIVADATGMHHPAIARGLASVPGSTQVLTPEGAELTRDALARTGNHALRWVEKIKFGIRESVKSVARDPGKRKQLIKTTLLGVGTGILYWLMFANEKQILDLSAKGHWYFVVPLMIALVFSLVHGTFTAEFWRALGVRAKKEEMR